MDEHGALDALAEAEYISSLMRLQREDLGYISHRLA
jgi:hypothetical protein